MGTNYLEIEGMSSVLLNKVKQDLKFKTGNFIWRVKFNIPLDPATVNNQTMFVSNADNEPLKTNIRYDAEKNIIEVEPMEAYAQDASYFLNITREVRSRGGQRLKHDLQVKFKL